MTSARLALIASVTAVVAWSAKIVVIWRAGGLDLSPWESPLFLVGVAAALVAAGAVGATLTSGRSAWVRGLAALGLALLLPAAMIPLGTAVEALLPGSWLWGETDLLLTAALLVGASAALQRRPGMVRRAPVRAGTDLAKP